MSVFFEIAYATVAKRLCLFTGTGFSKALSDLKMPGWKELLRVVCERNNVDQGLIDYLLPIGDEESPLRLEEAAQVIGLELERVGVDIYCEISKIIGAIELGDDLGETQEFFQKQSFRVVTTNYDKLAEELAGTDCQSLCSGLPVPRSNSRVKVFHVHGSVDMPEKMVVTSDDYFNFMSTDSYFSRKLSTILHENTVVIMGYSLGDTNLKAILNEYRGFVKTHGVSGNIFFVARGDVPQPIADYYASCYGIRVIPSTSVDAFFRSVSAKLASAELVYERSLQSVAKVIHQGRSFRSSFLKQDYSFYQVISALGALGESMENSGVVSMFGDIIGAKKSLCGEKDAWSQYGQLAEWLTHLGSLLDVEGRSIESEYLDAVQFSMEHMASRRALGYSWEAYKKWDAGWRTISAGNRKVIRAYIRKNSSDPDALEIVGRG